MCDGKNKTREENKKLSEKIQHDELLQRLVEKARKEHRVFGDRRAET